MEEGRLRNGSYRREVSRPCYHFLRLLGLWQPFDSAPIFKIYGLFAYMILAAVVVGIGAIDFRDKSFRWALLMNNIGTVLNFGCPFLFCQFYFHRSSYDRLISHISATSEELAKKLSLLSKLYTLLSFIIWCLCGYFVYNHWMQYFIDNIYFKVLYALISFYAVGWWACWMSVYGFVCHAHTLQIQAFVKSMKESMAYVEPRSRELEEHCVANLLKKFTEIRELVNKSEKDFSVIISLAVLYHMFDTLVFSVAYWRQDFVTVELWEYILGLVFDVFSIFFKLFPPAFLGEALHDIVKTSGEQCYLDIYDVKTPRERFSFYQYLFLKEEDMGFKVLGTKINSYLTVAVLFTMTTMALAFLRYAVPFLAHFKFDV